MSRPSVNACSTTSGTCSAAASSMQRSRWPRLECTPPSETSPTRCSAAGAARAAVAGAAQGLVLEQRAVRDRLVDPGEVLLDDRAGAEVEVTDLELPICPSGRPTSRPEASSWCADSVPELVEHGGVGQRDRVAGPGGASPHPSRITSATLGTGRSGRRGHRGSESPPADRERTRSGSRLAPPTRRRRRRAGRAARPRWRA